MEKVTEKTLPVEELAAQRLAVMVNAYTLLLKNLKEEGVNLDKVKAASDRTWQLLGQQAGELLKPAFEDTPPEEMTVQTGNMATEIHGMSIRREPMSGAHRTDFEACPWDVAANTFEVPSEWRLCRSGHEAFVKEMYRAINPRISVEMEETAAEGALCSETIRY